MTGADYEKIRTIAQVVQNLLVRVSALEDKHPTIRAIPMCGECQCKADPCTADRLSPNCLEHLKRVREKQ